MTTDVLNIFTRASLGEATEEDRKSLDDLDTDVFYSYLREFSGNVEPTVEVQIETKNQEPYEDFVYESREYSSQMDMSLKRGKEVFCEPRNINQARSFARILGLSRRFLKKQRVKN